MRINRFVSGIGTLFVMLLLIMLLAAAVTVATGTAADAAESEVFTVRNVPVDATAENAASAKTTALDQGYLDAYAQLIRRLVPEPDQPRVPQLTSRQVSDYTTDFSVTRERTSAVRYLAEITYRFKPEEIRRLFQSNGIGFAETQSKPAVVLPLVETPDGPLLWEEGNAWLQAWALRPASSGLVPIVVPLGDLGDVSSISAQEALEGDSARLSAIAARYGAASVLIGQAAIVGDTEAGGARLALTLTKHEAGRIGQRLAFENFLQQPEETADDFFRRVSDFTEDLVQENWKRGNVLQFGVESTIQVVAPVAGLDDWVKIRERMTGIPAVVRNQVVSLARDRVEMMITYIGDERQLTLALAQRDLTLSLNEVLNWELRLGSAGQAPESLPAAPAGDGGGSSVIPERRGSPDASDS